MRHPGGAAHVAGTLDAELQMRPRHNAHHSLCQSAQADFVAKRERGPAGAVLTARLFRRLFRLSFRHCRARRASVATASAMVAAALGCARVRVAEAISARQGALSSSG